MPLYRITYASDAANEVVEADRVANETALRSSVSRSQPPQHG
jgi:hypothetical protein